MISNNLKDTHSIAKEFAKKIESINNPGRATVLALYGDLGSGKTTFVKSLGTFFGIEESSITSPTFVIEKIFTIKNSGFFKKFIHIDAYRLENYKDKNSGLEKSEIEKWGWQDLLSDKENLIVIEWPEKIDQSLPDWAQKIYFKFIDENKREINFE